MIRKKFFYFNSRFTKIYFKKLAILFSVLIFNLNFNKFIININIYIYNLSIIKKIH